MGGLQLGWMGRMHVATRLSMLVRDDSQSCEVVVRRGERGQHVGRLSTCAEAWRVDCAVPCLIGSDALVAVRLMMTMMRSPWMEPVEHD